MEQLPEIIYIDGVLYTLYTTPLKPWLQGLDQPLEFDQRAPNCERGYIGRWKIDGDALWLTGIYAWRDGAYTGLADLFDGREEVPADWFSGPLVVEPASSEIADGAPLKVSTLLVENGRVVRTRDADPGSGDSSRDS